MGKNFRANLHSVNTIFLDYDGVLTEGTIYLTADGEALRTAYVKDGYAMQLAIKKGFRIVVISGGYSDSMKFRLEKLGLADIYLGVDDKMARYEEIIKSYNLKSEEVLYMGDDIPDLSPMKAAGVAACPADAVPEIREVADYISDKPGGRGCVRDVIEQVMKVQGIWMDNDAHHW
jgi:3-deoxy-D-manno-octulosonate 8-phosphate phosphatase (KDO 8-P phosphatase)